MTTKQVCFTTLLFLYYLVSTTSGSKIKFENKPKLIQPSLSSNMTLRCSLEDTNYRPSGAIVGRDVTNTTMNYPHATAITIMRHNSEHVASITSYGLPQALLYLSNMNVTGSVAGSSSERGFLEISFEYPTLEQCGLYICDISALTDQGHHVVFSTSLEVEVADMSVNDIIDHVHVLQVKNDKLEGELQCSKSEINGLKTKVTSVEGELQSSKSEISGLKTEVTSLKNQISGILSTLTRVQHIEQGTFNCYTHANSSKVVSRTFSRPYEKVPHLQYSLTHLAYTVGGTNPQYQVIISHLDESSFTLTCNRQSSITFTWNIVVSWISFPKQ